MYTNTIKIEYIWYKICTALLKLKTSPIWSFCPWWCSEGLTAGPTGRDTQQCESIMSKFTSVYTIHCSRKKGKECVKYAGAKYFTLVPCQTNARAITASWSCDQAETRYWTTSGPGRIRGDHTDCRDLYKPQADCDYVTFSSVSSNMTRWTLNLITSTGNWPGVFLHLADGKALFVSVGPPFELNTVQTFAAKTRQQQNVKMVSIHLTFDIFRVFCKWRD